MECCLSVSIATHQAGNMYCHLDNYGLKWTMARHYLNSLCKYQQKFVWKYPVSQGPGKEMNPKALCHLQTVSSFASCKREGTPVGSCGAEPTAFRWTLCDTGYSGWGGIFHPVRASKPYSETLLESKLCMIQITVQKISSLGVLWKFVPY